MRILVADDHALFRDSLASLLTVHQHEVVGQAANGKEAVQMTMQLKPEVVLMDLEMPDMNGLEATRLICADAAGTKVVILTGSDDDDNLFEAIKSGAQGYLLKNLEADDFFTLLERVAKEQLVLITSGASDWLNSSGTAERVDGGYRVTAHKSFCSGSPMGDLLLTSALYDDPTDGPTALHFSVPVNSPGLTIKDNWRTMAMRASGSNDIVLDGVFVPDAAISSRRPQGAWTPVWNVIAAIAAPPPGRGPRSPKRRSARTGTPLGHPVVSGRRSG